MLEPLIKAVQAAVVPELLNSGEHWSKPIYLPPAEPECDPIKVCTLTGLIDYIKADVDGEIHICHIQVVSPTIVKICNQLTHRLRQRETLVVADCHEFIGKGFQFGLWHDIEQFIIALQSQFAPTDARSQVLSIVGSIVDEDVRETNDDGVTQNVTTRKGIARKEDTRVPNPISLQPYRSFPEIEQPESDFVLRLRRESGGVQVALFEPGGGGWKCEAVKSIATFLKSELPDSIPVLA